jgi:hypothetical protein
MMRTIRLGTSHDEARLSRDDEEEDECDLELLLLCDPRSFELLEWPLCLVRSSSSLVYLGFFEGNDNDDDDDDDDDEEEQYLLS